MKKAVVFLSGGLDSATCLAIAQSQGYECYALTFNYGQRNCHEIECAKKIAAVMNVAAHKVFEINLQQLKGSALTDHSKDMPHERSAGIPSTYVPARNTIFLSIALGWAETLGVKAIFFGANADDHLNYPDCRPDYIDAFTALANVATREQGYEIHTPLLGLDKASIIRKGLALGVDYTLTLSCYDPTENGLACKKCDACYFRKQGFDTINKGRSV